MLVGDSTGPTHLGKASRRIFRRGDTGEIGKRWWFRSLHPSDAAALRGSPTLQSTIVKPRNYNSCEGPMEPTRLLSSVTAPAPRRYSAIARRSALAAAFAVAAITAACSSDSSTGPSNTPVTGAYPMATARGLTVPHTFTDAAGKKLTIEGGGLTLNANGTFELRYKGKLNALVFDLTDEGTYSAAGSTMTFTPDDGEPSYTGRRSGKSIMIDGFKIAGVKWDLGFGGK